MAKESNTRDELENSGFGLPTKRNVPLLVQHVTHPTQTFTLPYTLWFSWSLLLTSRHEPRFLPIDFGGHFAFLAA